MKYQQISIIGAGNVAWHLALALERAGHTINEVYSRDIIKAEQLANSLYNSDPVDDLDFETSTSDVFIIAVPDDAIEVVARQLLVPTNALVAHTSGSQPIDILMGYDFEPAVFYPLQTFTKGTELDIQEVPFCIEALNAESLKLVQALAKTVSRRVEIISSEQRKTLHLAAVFACNFSNHLFHLASNVLEADELEFDLLHSLIAETVNKALEIGPARAQTGPAIRGDQRTMKKHLDLLVDNPELHNLYQQLSQSIVANK